MARSQDIVVQSPTSLTGSALRLWKITRIGPAWFKWITVPLALVLIVAAWCVCIPYTLIWGPFLIPGRVIGRRRRERQRDDLKHAEILSALEAAGT